MRRSLFRGAIGLVGLGIVGSTMIAALPADASVATATTAAPIQLGDTLLNDPIETAMTGRLAAVGGSGALTYTVTGGAVPTGLRMTTAGAFTGLPTTAGTYHFTVGVHDTARPPNTTAGSVEFIVNPMAVATTSYQVAVAGTFKGQLTADGGKSAIKWAVTQGALPPGIKLSTAGAFTGAATAEGTFPITVTATDASKPANVATSMVTMTITPIAINTASLPNGIVKKAYSAKLAETGGKTPLKYLVSSGGLPPGMKLSTTGAFTGSPTTAGAFSFTITLSDGTKPTPFIATATYTLVIN